MMSALSGWEMTNSFWNLQDLQFGVMTIQTPTNTDGEGEAPAEPGVINKFRMRFGRSLTLPLPNPPAPIWSRTEPDGIRGIWYSVVHRFPRDTDRSAILHPLILGANGKRVREKTYRLTRQPEASAVPAAIRVVAVAANAAATIVVDVPATAAEHPIGAICRPLWVACRAV